MNRDKIIGSNEEEVKFNIFLLVCVIQYLRLPSYN